MSYGCITSVSYGHITLISKLWVYHSHKWAIHVSPSSVSYGHTTLITELRVSIMGGLDPKNELIVTWWSHIVLQIWAKIGSGNGLVLSGTKPLTEPMLTLYEWGSVEFTLKNFHSECPSYCSAWYKFENYTFEVTATSPRDQWVN